MNLENQITINKLFELAQDKIFSELNVSLPGRIESYDPDRQVADIKPLIKKKLSDANGSSVSLPVLKNVPVHVISSNGGKAFVSLPFAVGDLGMIIFTDRSMDEYISGRGQEVNPRDVRKHHLSDAFFIPGINPELNSLSEVPALNMRLQNDLMSVELFPSGKISIQGASVELITLLIDLVEALTSPTYIVSPAAPGPHTHTVTQPALDIILAQLKLQLISLQGASV